MKELYQKDVTLVQVSFNAHDCPNCGIAYALTDEYERRRLTDGKSWYCPNGHSISFVDSTEKKLKEAKAEIESLKNERERLTKQAQEQSRKVKRLKARAKAGVCAFCHRHFENVQRHMESKHPGPQEEIS